MRNGVLGNRVPRLGLVERKMNKRQRELLFSLVADHLEWQGKRATTIHNGVLWALRALDVEFRKPNVSDSKAAKK